MVPFVASCFYNSVVITDGWTGTGDTKRDTTQEERPEPRLLPDHAHLPIEKRAIEKRNINYHNINAAPLFRSPAPPLTELARAYPKNTQINAS